MSQNEEMEIQNRTFDKEARLFADVSAESDHQSKLNEESRAAVPTIAESKVHEYIKNRLATKTQGGNLGYKIRRQEKQE